MTRIKRDPKRITQVGRRARLQNERVQMAHLIGAVRRGQSWFKAPAGPKLLMTGTRISIGGTDLTPSLLEAPVGSYAWAKARAMEAGQESAAEFVGRELHRPNHSGNHRTARFAGKAYHWRQDYTGQLKLAAGDSPW